MIYAGVVPCVLCVVPVEYVKKVQSSALGVLIDVP